MIDFWEIPAIDQHAHNLLQPETVDNSPYPNAFTEGYDSEIVNHHARHTLFYRRSLREIAQLLECEPTEAAILERRQQLGLEKLTERCLLSANLKTIFRLGRLFALYRRWLGHLGKLSFDICLHFELSLFWHVLGKAPG